MVTLTWDKIYYEGGNLVVEAILCNRQHAYVETLETVSLSVYDSSGNLFASGSFSDVAAGLGRNGVKSLKFTIKKAPVKDITIPDVSGLFTYVYRL